MQSLKDFIKESLEDPSLTVVRNADEKLVEDNNTNKEKTVAENAEASGENGNQEIK